MTMVQRLHEETAQYPILSVIQPMMTLGCLTVLLRAQMARLNIWWSYEKQVDIHVGKSYETVFSDLSAFWCRKHQLIKKYVNEVC